MTGRPYTETDRAEARAEVEAQAAAELEQAPKRSKADKWKQHHDAEKALARHWKARRAAMAAIHVSFAGRWKPKLQAILDSLDSDVRGELPESLLRGEPSDG